MGRGGLSDLAWDIGSALKRRVIYLGRGTGQPEFLSVWKQGVMVGVLNPKVAIFFLAFLPQFVVTGAGPVWAQLFLHGLLIIVVAAFIEPPIVLAGDRLTSKLRGTPAIGRWMGRSLGSIFIALGIRLALQERH